MQNNTKKAIIYAIATMSYFALWLYVLYPMLDNLLKGV